MEEDKKVNEIEVVEPKVVKPRKKKKAELWKFLEDVGTDEKGEIRYKKGQSYELSKKQIDNYLNNKIICQH
ncbi:hypothetical protein [Tenacibaculum sp.]|uniref:hypothetical protein n=1 Tax=Tenacibaculum sp. TaxID=1906242 RepID=UPI003D0A0322